jgi:chromosomal replication initiator protein
MPRLINRLKKGLVVDILKPTYNLKFELVKSKIEDSELFLTPNLIKYFIEKCNTDNLKNLNFYLNKIIAFFSVTRQNFNEKTIDDIVNKASVLPEIITVEDIQKHVSRYFNIKVEDIRSKLRTKELVLPKHIAMYLCRELTDYSLKKISSDFGKVDKTTISHAYRKVKKLINSDDKMCCTVKNLTKLLFNRELCHK